MGKSVSGFGYSEVGPSPRKGLDGFVSELAYWRKSIAKIMARKGSVKAG